jgi:hypothetical protein
MIDAGWDFYLDRPRLKSNWMVTTSGRRVEEGSWKRLAIVWPMIVATPLEEETAGSSFNASPSSMAPRISTTKKDCEGGRERDGGKPARERERDGKARARGKCAWKRAVEKQAMNQARNTKLIDVVWCEIHACYSLWMFLIWGIYFVNPNYSPNNSMITYIHIYLPCASSN